jgi:hypothetical protein
MSLEGRVCCSVTNKINEERESDGKKKRRNHGRRKMKGREREREKLYICAA